MTTGQPLASVRNMPTHEIDRETRLRVAAHLRQLKYKFQFESDAAMAERLGLSRGVVNRALKGERTVGLDVLLKIHRKLHVSIDWLVDEPPPEEWMDPDYEGPGL
jgi:transcriptional regulator with XRE-family HTH domain